MTLRSFLDAAEALLVNEYQRLGVDLMQALEQAAPWSSGGLVANEVSQADVSAPHEAAVAAQNEQSLQMLSMMMAGAQKA